MLDHIRQIVRGLAPSLGLDPDLVRVDEFTDGVASVALGEACASCPGSIPALVARLEAGLRERVPEVEVVEAVL